MAQEATIQGVVNELMDVNKVLHSAADMHLEALFNIESAINAVDTKVGLLLEAPAIQDTLKQFSEDIVNGITGSFDAALAYQMKQDKQGDRDEKGEVKEGKGFRERVKGSFQKGLTEGFGTPKVVESFTSKVADFALILGQVTEIFKNLGPNLFIFLTGFRNLDLLGKLTKFGKLMGRLALPVTAAIATINGLIDAFKAFTGTDGDIIAKLSSAIRAFFGGVIDVFAFIPDMVKGFVSDGIRAIFGDNFLSDLLDDFSFGDIPKMIVNYVYTFIEDILEGLRDVIVGLGDMISNLFDGAVAWLQEYFPGIFEGIQSMFDGISEIFDTVSKWIDDKVAGLRDFFNIGDDKKEDEFVNLTNDQQRDELESARRSGLYNKNLIGESEVDPEKIAAASNNQLQAILDDDDIDEPTKEIVVKELQQRLGPREIDKQVSSEVGAKRGMDLGTSDTSMKANGKRGKTIESSSSTEKKVGGITVEKDGKPVKLSKKDADQVAAISAISESMGNEGYDVSRNAVVEAPASPSVVNNTTNNSSVLQEVTVPKRAAKTTPSKGTLGTAMKRKPAGEGPNEYVTKDPVSGKWRAFAPNLAATGKDAYALFDTVKEANEYTKSVDPEHEKMMADELAAFDAEFGLTAPGSDSGNKISGAQGAAAQSGELEARQNDLSTAQAQQSQAASNVAVVDNSQQQSVVNNNTTSGVNPSPFDKSDRTHKRGSYRGT